MATKVIMPKLGESVVEGTVTRWLKQEGEQVDEFEALLEINTDKVDSEIPSPAKGTLLKILVPEGVTVQAGTVIAWIGQPGEAVPGGEAPAPAGAAAEPILEPVEGAGSRDAPIRDRDLGFISPVVAKLAREYNLDLSQVRGTGAGGRITKKDVLQSIEKRGKSAPVPEHAEGLAPWETPGEGDLFRPTEMIFGAPAQAAPKPSPKPGEAPLKPGLHPLNTMRKAIADRMVASMQAVPHVTTVMEADLKRVAAHRERNQAEFNRQGVKLTFTAYFAAAAVSALRAFPLVNSSWSNEGILVHPQINLGIAVSLGEDGLIVPVIRDADNLSLFGLARAISDLAERARARRLAPDDVRNGTFTITNHGTGGSLFATPIINQPQCAILGVGIIHKRPVVVEGDAIAVRPMVYLSLTFDHRILDGASADGFLARIVSALEKWPD
jgi:2-oxoglutarate dehydrogenase E2 component (dihydrolipoamide succinyltransferase)